MIAIHLKPGARRDEILGEEQWRGSLEVRVSQPAVDGKGNEALLKLLSQRLGVPVSGLTIVRGLRSRNKNVKIQGLTPQEVARRLSERV